MGHVNSQTPLVERVDFTLRSMRSQAVSIAKATDGTTPSYQKWQEGFRPVNADVSLVRGSLAPR
jgi:hypothetical protein